MNKRRPCMVCYFKSNTLSRLTEFECVNCHVPCCALGCYDAHRNCKNLDDFLTAE